MPKSQFALKADELRNLSDNGALFKAPNPLPPRLGIEGEYKNQLIKRVFAQFGEHNPALAKAIRNRIVSSMNPDHVWELQLGGPDDVANLHILDADVNQGIGRQIRRQIRTLPDYTPIRVRIIGPK